MPEMENGRVEFTAEMKKTHTILIPNMLPVHFKLIKNVFEMYNYKVEILHNEGRAVADTGLQYVHNDTCYPALLVIGQMIDALNSGKYDLDHVALMITQTGGGCRASNYIHLLRKALKKAGYGQIPVISLNWSGVEKSEGFKLTMPMLAKALYMILYGDMLMLLRNQTIPYENEKGAADRLVNEWADRLAGQFNSLGGFSPRLLKQNMQDMVRDFEAVPVTIVPKVKVGIVGEIYVKYSSLANNQLEKFLYEQDCEVMVPGLLGFMGYCLQTRMEDKKLYGGNPLADFAVRKMLQLMLRIEGCMIEAVKTSKRFTPPPSFEDTMKSCEGVIGLGCKMGEGWLLTGEIMDLVHNGYENVICAQPFGCLPNHIVGKGMIRRVRELCPGANIVPIDYDPGATRVNQENRIKLMLAVARENMAKNGGQRPVERTETVEEAAPRTEFVPNGSGEAAPVWGSR